MQEFVKHYPDQVTAQKAVIRAWALHRTGVATPKPTANTPIDKTVNFELVEGNSGRSLLRHSLGGILQALSQFHRSNVTGLAAYDPLTRIRPRLHLLDDSSVMYRVLDESVPIGTHTLHGDFHVGQLIKDTKRKVWIVDLDDMAIGPPEADLGNFAAHLATSSVETGFDVEHWRSRILTTWNELVGPCDLQRFERFLRFALVRRHLKLLEANKENYQTEIETYLKT